MFSYDNLNPFRVKKSTLVMHVSVITQYVVASMAFTAPGEESVSDVMDASAIWSQQQTCHTIAEVPVHASAHLPRTV